MIHVKFIQRPNVLDKYQNQYNVLNMNDVHNNVNILQLYDTNNHNNVLKSNLKRLSQIYLLLTHQKNASKSKRSHLLKTFRLLMVGFYRDHHFVDNHFHVSHLDAKNSDFPTIPMFTQYLTSQFKDNVHKPNTLSFLESLEIAFNNLSNAYGKVVTHSTYLNQAIDSAVNKHQTKLIINLVPFYKKQDSNVLYSIALTTIAFFKDYGVKHPNVQLQLDVKDLMVEPKFPKKKVVKQQKHTNNVHTTNALNPINNHKNSIVKHHISKSNNYNYSNNNYVPRHSRNVQKYVGNNERKSTMNNQEDLIKNMYFTDLIQHQFGKAQRDLQGLKNDLSTSDYQMLTSDLADQEEAYRKFGDDLTKVAEKLFN